MFKLSTDPRFTHTVKVQVPVDRGHEEQSFKATFKVLPIDQLDAGEGDEANEADRQVRLLKDVIVDLGDMVDDAGEAIPYSEAIRDQLIGIPYVRIALVRTYIAAITKVKAGN
ncbi:MAG: hypothetical protein U9R07_17245 [Pseudomonadota bacterium]|nr:hypothetical protein [Pseudomonadota bacterium]